MPSHGTQVEPSIEPAVTDLWKLLSSGEGSVPRGTVEALLNIAVARVQCPEVPCGKVKRGEGKCSLFPRSGSRALFWVKLQGGYKGQVASRDATRLSWCSKAGSLSRVGNQGKRETPTGLPAPFLPGISRSLFVHAGTDKACRGGGGVTRSGTHQLHSG